jgi:hypothetical protein
MRIRSLFPLSLARSVYRSLAHSRERAPSLCVRAHFVSIHLRKDVCMCVRVCVHVRVCAFTRVCVRACTRACVRGRTAGRFLLTDKHIWFRPFCVGEEGEEQVALTQVLRSALCAWRGGAISCKILMVNLA